MQAIPFKNLLTASEQKYSENNISMVRNAVLHHEDIDFSVPMVIKKLVAFRTPK
jgi:hypothetical protein